MFISDYRQSAVCCLKSSPELSRRFKASGRTLAPTCRRKRPGGLTKGCLGGRKALDILERVCEIIADATQNAAEEITERSTAKNVDGWDAVAQVSIVAAI